LENLAVNDNLQKEAISLLIKYLDWKADYSNWNINDVYMFLVERPGTKNKDEILNKDLIQSQTKSTLTSESILIQFVNEFPPHQRVVFLHEFLLALKEDNCSKATIRNYKSDINQFLSFINKNNLKIIFTKPKLDSFYRYQKQKNLSDNSIKRKFSSIIQFALWLKRENILDPGPAWLKEGYVYQKPGKKIDYSFIPANPLEDAKPLTQEVKKGLEPKTPDENDTLKKIDFQSAPDTNKKQHTSLNSTYTYMPHPLSHNRLAKAKSAKPTGKNTKLPNIKFDPKHKATARKNQIKRARIKYDFAKLSDRFNQKVKQVKDVTPPFVLPYLNFAIIILFFIGLAIFGYRQFYSDVAVKLAYPTALTPPSRVLSFQGRLTDTAQTPITSSTNLTFSLHDAVSDGVELWNSNTCAIDPDQDGIFVANLGAGSGAGADNEDCGGAIADSVFTENSNIWLEVDVSAETLTPRQPIRTVGYALNSETLQGYPPAPTGGATANTVITMNNAGAVVFAETSPTLTSTSGTFTIEGQALILQTASGTNGDIVLEPDGSGEIQLNAGNITVEEYISHYGDADTYYRFTDDHTEFGIGGETIFTAHEDESQDYIELGDDGDVDIKLSGGADGALFVEGSSGNVGIGTTDPGHLLDIYKNDAGSNVGLRISNSDGIGGTINADNQELVFRGTVGTEIVFSINDNKIRMGAGSYTKNFELGLGAMSQNGNGGGLTFSDTEARLSNGLMITSGNVGINTTTPSEILDVVGNVEFSGSLEPNGSAGTSGQFLISAGASAPPTWSSSIPATSLAWDDLTAPDDNLSLGMTTYTTDFNWATGTSTNDLFSLTTNASANGTGSLLNIQTGTSATVLPLRVRAGATEALAVDAAGNIGIGTTTPGNAHLYVFDDTLISTDTFYGIRSSHIKTTDAGDPSDDYYGLYSGMQFDKWDEVGIDTLYGARFEAGISEGLVSSGLYGSYSRVWIDGSPAGVNPGDVTAIHGMVDIDAVTLVNDIYGLNIDADIEAVSLSGDVYGAYIHADIDSGSSITSYLLYLKGETNVDWGMYQADTAIPNYFAGNVSIGTTTPSEMLDVVGNIEFSGSLEPNGSAGTSGQFLTSAGASSPPTWSSTVPATSLAWDDLTAPDDNLSLGMTTYTTDFNWATGTSTNDLFSLTTDESANGTGSLLNIQTGTSATVLPLRVRAGATEALAVDATGNVGIGSTVPANTLDVNGGIDATTLNTGQGDYELYAMNQDVQTTDTPTFTRMTLVNSSLSEHLRFASSSDSTFYNQVSSSYDNGIDNANSLEFWIGTAAKAHVPTLTATGAQRVGIGIVNPSAPLDVRFDGGIYIGDGSDLQLTISSDDVYFKNVTQDQDIYINVNDGGADTTAIFIQGTSGNVGIGTASPGGVIEVQTAANKSILINSIASSSIVDVDDLGSGLLFTRPSDGSLVATGIYGYQTASDTKFNLAISSRDEIVFAIGNGIATAIEAMRIDSSGNVGIGTTSPDDNLHVNGGIRTTATTGGGIGSYGVFYYSSGSTNILSNGPDATTRGKIQLIHRESDNGNINVAIEIATNGNVLLGQSSGNVGIGTVNPAFAARSKGLDIAGAAGRFNAPQDANTRIPTLRITDTVTDYGSGTATRGEIRGGIEFYSSESTGVYPAIGAAIYDVNENTYNTEHGLAFYTNNDLSAPTEKMRITNDGRVGIGTTAPTNTIQVADLIWFDDPNYSTYIGTNSDGNSSTGDNNTFLGYLVGYSNTSGFENTFSGSGPGYSNTTGNDNTFSGYVAGYTNVSGDENSFYGSKAGFNSTGNDNTFSGYAAGFISTGDGNSFYGHSAGMLNLTGTNNTIIGNAANLSGTNYSNATALGYNALVTATDYVRIGNTSVTEISGQVVWSNPSDERIKKNITDNDLGLDFIMKLRPVNFEMKEGHEGIIYDGFIAQEVEAILDQQAANFSGLLKPANETDKYSLSYATFTVPLVNAVQEQQSQIKQLALNNPTFDNSGNLIIDQDTNGDYQITQTIDNSIVTHIGAFAEVISARIQAGLIETKELIADSLSSTQAEITNLNSELIESTNIISLNTETQNLIVSDESQLGNLIAQNASISGKTQLGELIAQTANIEQLNSLKIETEKLEIASASGEIVALIDNTGHSEFKSSRMEYLESKLAQLETVTAQTALLMDATISGTLYAENIAGFEEKVADAFQQPSLLNQLLGENDLADTSDVIAAIDSAGYNATSSAELQQTLADLSLETDDVVINPSAAYINKYFEVNGSGYVADALGVGNYILVGNDIKIGGGAIQSNSSLAFTAASTLSLASNSSIQIQPGGTGNVSIMANLMILDETGQVTINGDLQVAGTTKTESLLTDLIKPTNFENPIQVQVAGVATDSAEIKKSEFQIIDELGTPVATISADGRATFKALSIESEDQTATDSAEININKTSGKAKIAASKTDIVINSTHVTENTLIYVTPLGSTDDQTLYIKQQNSDDPDTAEVEGLFVVGFNTPLTTDLEFNWWLVN